MTIVAPMSLRRAACFRLRRTLRLFSVFVELSIRLELDPASVSANRLAHRLGEGQQQARDKTEDYESPSLSVQRKELLPEPEPSKSHSTRSDGFVFSEPLQLQHLASFSRQLDGDAIHLSAHPFGTLGMAV